MKVAFYTKTVEGVNKIKIMCLNKNVWTMVSKFIIMNLKAIYKIENDTVFISFSVSNNELNKPTKAKNIFQQKRVQIGSS